MKNTHKNGVQKKIVKKKRMEAKGTNIEKYELQNRLSL